MGGTPDGRSGASAGRQKRLAEALRANLKRRKAPAKAEAEQPDPATQKPETDPP